MSLATATADESLRVTDAQGHPPKPNHAKPRNDFAFRTLCLTAVLAMMATLLGLVGSLVSGGWLALSHFGFSFFTTSTWDPVADQYGAAAPIVGTLITAFLALLFALPVAVG